MSSKRRFRPLLFQRIYSKIRAFYQSPEHILNYVTIIQQEVKRIQTQVERVLQIAAFDRGNVQFRWEEIDLHECIQNALRGIELLVQQKNGKLSLQLGANPSVISADLMHITNVIFNLLDNGLKYTASG
jgi:two-component system, OmpR family, phosphate regulon sensor histidine kinase PhoR